jgi:putative restriction endonuclease
MIGLKEFFKMMLEREARPGFSPVMHLDEKDYLAKSLGFRYNTQGFAFGGIMRSWTREELTLAFNLYCRLPFGKLHKNNPEIIRVAESLDRSPSALAMKLVNFASFDPAHLSRNVKGLKHASAADRKIWDEFNTNWEKLAFESQRVLERVVTQERPSDISEDIEFKFPSGPTEAQKLVRVRLVQNFFRESVLSSYEYRCAFCKLNLNQMLCASHIIPWSKNVERRADPANGLCLCAFHDRAFDRGLMAVDEQLRIIIAHASMNDRANPVCKAALVDLHGEAITLPKRFLPDKQALAFHRENIFGNN